MNELPLTAEQEAEAQRIAAILRQKFEEESLRLARLLAAKPDAELLGKTEYEVRDRVHALGAAALATALAERKKGGARGAASVARTARKRRGS